MTEMYGSMYFARAGVADLEPLVTKSCKIQYFGSVICSVPDVACLDLSSWLHHYSAFCIGS